MFYLSERCCQCERLLLGFGAVQKNKDTLFDGNAAARCPAILQTRWADPEDRGRFARNLLVP
jgi:hypothetical protein